MFYMIVECIREDDHIVDESSTVIVINFQYSVYKVLYMRREVCKSYKDYLRMFYPLLIDKNESIVVIRMYRQLKEEIRYVDNCDISFFIN